jgi:integrase
MPANDGKVRERVATADEAAKLIEALPVSGSAGALSWESVTEIRASSQSAVALGRRLGVSDALVGKVRRGELYKTPDGRRSRETGDRAGWGLAFYTGMRRSEIGRAQWPHVFWEADEIMVAQSKSEAGEGRRVPMVGPLKKILREEWMRMGRPETGRIVKRSVLSGKWQARADAAWERAGLARVTLHEARHTYASFMMAAGYNLKQIQEYLGHADLVTTGRYIKICRFLAAPPRVRSWRPTSPPRSVTWSPEMWTGIWTGLSAPLIAVEDRCAPMHPGLYGLHPGHFQGFARIC